MGSAAAVVIIPAHNEAAVIGRCLAALLDDGDGAELLRVVVVCNGCTDGTADLVRRRGDSRITVVETEVPSKSNALNLGDRAAEAMGIFPRFFVDADILLTGRAVSEVARTLHERPGSLVAAPRIEFDVSHCSWGVRQVYRIWLETPYCGNGMVGSGVYVLTEAGRRRFGEFPDITADDAFVRQSFTPAERLTVETCKFTVFPPRTMRGVVAIKTRSFFGNYEFEKRFPHLALNSGPSNIPVLLRMATRPSYWIPLTVYLFVKAWAKAAGSWRFWRGSSFWDRDETSREAGVVSGQHVGAGK